MRYLLLLCAFLLSPSNAQTTQLMVWSAFIESDCSDTPTYNFMTPINECFNSSVISFNPYNLTSPFIKVIEKGTDQLVGLGCTSSLCDTCQESETIKMIPACTSNTWLGNTTAYFSYSVVSGLVPQSKEGGIIYQYYSPNDTTCSGPLVGANIQENGVCTNGMKTYIWFNVLWKKKRKKNNNDEIEVNNWKKTKRKRNRISETRKKY